MQKLSEYLQNKKPATKVILFWQQRKPIEWGGNRASEVCYILTENNVKVNRVWFDLKHFSKRCTAANHSGIKATQGDRISADVHISAVSLEMCWSLDLLQMDTAAESIHQLMGTDPEGTDLMRWPGGKHKRLTLLASNIISSL